MGVGKCKFQSVKSQENWRLNHFNCINGKNEDGSELSPFLKQVERIEFIDEVIKDQRKREIHRTDPKEMEKLLLEKFGGEVTRIESKELIVLPTTLESFQESLIQQNKEMNAMREMIEELVKGQLELKSYIKESLPGRVQLEEHDRELLLSLKETMASRKKELDMAETAATEKEEKPGLFARFFKKR